MQKHVNLVDLVKSFPTNIYLQNLASIQKRTSSVKFAQLAEKSWKGSISNLSTKAGSGALLARGRHAGTVFTDAAEAKHSYFFDPALGRWLRIQMSQKFIIARMFRENSSYFCRDAFERKSRKRQFRRILIMLVGVGR